MFDYFSSTPSATLASRVSSSSSGSSAASKRSYGKDGVSLRDLSSPLSSSPPVTSNAASEVRANLSELKQQMREFSGLTASTTASSSSASNHETSYGRSLSYTGLGRKFSSPSLMMRQNSPIGRLSTCSKLPFMTHTPNTLLTHFLRKKLLEFITY